MSTTARSARLRLIWNHQARLNDTRAQLLSHMPDDEHRRFTTMYPLPPQDKDEVQDLTPSREEVLESMWSGADAGGWGVGVDFGYHAEGEVEAWGDESTWGGDSDYGLDEEDAREVEVEGWSVEVNMDKVHDDSGVELCESDNSRCSPEPAAAIEPDFNSTSTSSESAPEQIDSSNHPNPTLTFTCNFMGSDSDPDTPEAPESAASPDPEDSSKPPLPKFTPAALNGPITAETLLAFEKAYSELYAAGASVWRSTRTLDSARYEAFLERRHRRRDVGASRLRGEVLVGDLEGWEWGARTGW